MSTMPAVSQTRAVGAQMLYGEPRPVQIIPSVLPADWANMGAECKRLEEAGVDRIQFDVMDGNFVPNLTFGPELIKACRKYTKTPFETQLMVSNYNCDSMLEEYVEATKGPNGEPGVVIVHVEANVHLHRTLDRNAEAHKEYIFGNHVKEYMESLIEDDEEAYQKQFSRYIKESVGPDEIEPMYEACHAGIRKDPFVKRDPLDKGHWGKRETPKPTEFPKKQWQQQKISKKQRAGRVRQKLANLLK